MRTLGDEADTGSPSWLTPRASRSVKRGMVMQDRTDPDALLTPSEVAEMFRVNPKTVTRWARAGKISAIRTLGGHRRFRAVEIMHYLEQVESEQGL
jgi:excisionase family DNA binding protein